ncbi:MAG: hypothetical protein M3Y87_14565, partial [Myxococcota bacterium]|nr:hypothetical protein [Myxococcota bacterium]
WGAIVEPPPPPRVFATDCDWRVHEEVRAPSWSRPALAATDATIDPPADPQARSDARRARALAVVDDRRAVDEWRDRGPHYEWVVECAPGGCRHVPYAVDPERGLRVLCASESLVECVRIVGRPPVYAQR